MIDIIVCLIFVCVRERVDRENMRKVWLFLVPHTKILKI